MLGFPGFTGQLILNVSQRMDYATSTVTYYGYAAPGTLLTDAGWQIKRETTDTSGRTIAIDFANNSLEPNQVWSNRTALFSSAPSTSG